MNLDSYQTMAVNNKDKRVLLIAPPGSGKTTVLLKKIRTLIEEGVSPLRILVLTFSKAAAVNMKDRFLKSGNECPWFGTIHAFCYKKISSEEKFGIIAGSMVFKSLKPLKDKYHLTNEEIERLLSLISKRRNNSPIGSGESVVDSSCITDEIFPEYFIKEAEKCYGAFKSENKLYDFDDLEEKFMEKLGDENFLKSVRESYDWILVDEFQDLNDVQLKILKLISEDACFFGVGDEDQCIYEFRGSNTDAMVNFESYFPGGIKLYLKYNYRSSNTIIKVANSIIRNNKKRNNKVIENSRVDETRIKIIKALDEDDSYCRILDIIKKLPDTESTAIIMRTNGEMDGVMRPLFKAGIDFSLIDYPYNYYNRGLFKDIVDYMEFSISMDREALVNIMDKPGFGMAHGVKDIILGDRFKNPLEILLGQSKNPETKEKILRFFECMDKLKRLKPIDAIDWIVYGFKYSRYLENIAKKYDRSIHDYLSDLKDLKEKVKFFETIGDFLDYRKEYMRVLSSKHSSMDKVVLTTMHGSKGMEFDNVFILNCVEGMIPHVKSPKGDEGERRLFYVAVTRARNDLYILCPERVAKRKASISPYINECLLLELM